MAKRLPDGMVQRGKVYWADFRAGGRRVRKSLSTNLKTARELLIEHAPGRSVATMGCWTTRS